MKFYSCSSSAPDLASRDECSLTSAIFEMDKLAKHCLRKKKRERETTTKHQCVQLADLHAFLNFSAPLL